MQSLAYQNGADIERFQLDKVDSGRQLLAHCLPPALTLSFSTVCQPLLQRWPTQSTSEDTMTSRNSCAWSCGDESQTTPAASSSSPPSTSSAGGWTSRRALSTHHCLSSLLPRPLTWIALFSASAFALGGGRRSADHLSLSLWWNVHLFL